MDLIKQYVTELEQLNQQVINMESIGQNHTFEDGRIYQLGKTIHDLIKQGLTDRFFLEEIVHDIMDCGNDYSSLTKDFLHEYVNNLPMTESDRNHYIENVLGNPRTNYFESERHLKFYLKYYRLPTIEELRQNTIENIIN